MDYKNPLPLPTEPVPTEPEPILRIPTKCLQDAITEYFRRHQNNLKWRLDTELLLNKWNKGLIDAYDIEADETEARTILINLGILANSEDTDDSEEEGNDDE